MANINAPNGLSPVGYLNGAPWNQQVRLYCIPSTDNNQYGIGDVVLSLAGGDAKGVPQVVKAAATDIPRGVIVGIDPVLTAGLSLQGTALSLETIAIPATKAKDYYVYVADDPQTIFEIQCNNTATLLAADTMGSNAKIVVANPATGSPYSGSYLDKDNIDTTSTFMLKILGLSRRVGADFTAYARFLVTFNVHELKSVGTTSV